MDPVITARFGAHEEKTIMQTLSVIWAWVQLHPALVLLAWPALTALVNLVFGEAEKYAESHPWAHAALSFVEASGFDARGVLAVLKKLLVKVPSASMVFSLIGAVWISAMVAATQTACGASQSQIQQTEQDGMKLAACVLSEVFAGVTDPGAIGGQCVGALPAVIVDVINDFQAKGSDAGAAMASPQQKLLDEAKAKAVAAIAAKASGK